MTTLQFTYLLNGWLAGTLSIAEAEEFTQYAGEPEYRALLDEAIDTDSQADSYENRSTAEMRRFALAKLKEHPAFAKHANLVTHGAPCTFLKNRLVPLAAAILLIIE